jgi:hypothetical protein
VNYQPQAEPVARTSKKRQAVATVVVPLPLKKASAGKRRKRPSSRDVDKTSEQEELLVKPL